MPENGNGQRYTVRSVGSAGAGYTDLKTCLVDGCPNEFRGNFSLCEEHRGKDAK